MSNFSERYARIKRLDAQIVPLRVRQFKWDTLYRNEAVQCFQQHFPISCIVVSSALVETCLCWERFRRNSNDKETSNVNDRWDRNLSDLLKEFIDSNIPIEKLLDTDENLKNFRNDRKKIANIRYVLTTKMFAHGRILFPITRLPPLIPLNRHKFDRGDLYYPSTYLSILLPINEKELIAYGVDGNEPTLETVAYVHLFKTLRFMKTFADKKF